MNFLFNEFLIGEFAKNLIIYEYDVIFLYSFSVFEYNKLIVSESTVGCTLVNMVSAFHRTFHLFFVNLFEGAG